MPVELRLRSNATQLAGILGNWLAAAWHAHYTCRVIHLRTDRQRCSVQTSHCPSQPHFVFNPWRTMRIFSLPLRVGDWVGLSGGYYALWYTYVGSMLVFWIYCILDLIFFCPPVPHTTRLVVMITVLLINIYGYWLSGLMLDRSHRLTTDQWIVCYMGQIGHQIQIVQLSPIDQFVVVFSYTRNKVKSLQCIPGRGRGWAQAWVNSSLGRMGHITNGPFTAIAY